MSLLKKKKMVPFFASNGNSEKVRAPYGIQPTTLRDLVGCSNHWVTYWILDGEQRWTCHVLLLEKTHLVVGWLNLRYAFMWLHDAVMSHTCLSWFDYVTALDRISSGSVVRASDQTREEGGGFERHLVLGFFSDFLFDAKNESRSTSTPPLRIITSKDVGFYQNHYSDNPLPRAFCPFHF